MVGRALYVRNGSGIPFERRYGRGAFLGPKVNIGSHVCTASTAVIFGSTVINNGASVEEYAVIHRGAAIGMAVVSSYAVIGANTVIYKGCRIGKGADIGCKTVLKRDVVVGAGAEIGSHARLLNGVVVGQCATVGGYNRIPSYTEIPCGAVIPPGNSRKRRNSLG